MLSGSHQFRTFFSHKYKATRTNLYFWSVLSAEAGFQFEVDEGAKPISVTRLERMMRESDTVIGIFAFTGGGASPTREDLLKESAYFRLETDLAIRSGKPTLLFVDRRYASIFPSMPNVHLQYFDAREIESGTVSPSHERFVATCHHFCEEALAHKAREFSRREIDPNNVVIVLSGNSPSSVYGREMIDRMEQVLDAQGIPNPTIMKFPDAKDRFQLSKLDSASWVIADVGPELFRTGLVGYLHGRFIPMVRLFHEGDGAGATIGEHRCLHAGIEKGYDSDLLRWKDGDTLAQGLEDRIKLLQSPKTLIPDVDAALRYFSKASLRKETIFLSYCGRDIEIAEQISAALKARFQDVFNYKDGRSIRPGEPWLSEIDINLRKATIGVQLLSPAYLESANCMEEARIMNGLLNDNKIKVLPLRLKDETLNAPTWLADKQYARFSQMPGTGAVVEEVLRVLERAG